MAANKTMLSSVSWTNLWLDNVRDKKSRSISGISEFSRMVGYTANKPFIKALYRVFNMELYFTEKQQSSAIDLS